MEHPITPAPITMASNSFKNGVCTRRALTVAEFFEQSNLLGWCEGGKVARCMVPRQYCCYKTPIIK